MKKKLFTIAIVAFFAACNNNPKTGSETTTTSTADSFRNSAAADKGQVIELKGVNDTIVTGDGNRYVKVDPNQPQKAPVATAAPALKIPRETTHHTHTTRSYSSSGSGSSGDSYGGESTTSAPVAAKKKGWSKAAKGTAIGAGVGAITGALVSKKKGLGAVIGGVAGGAGGYLIGRGKDKKDGRVQ